MAFPDIRTFVKCQPGPYERRMGPVIVRLLRVFDGRVPDVESHARIVELVATPELWSAGHAVFDEVRRRLLAAMKTKDASREWQHHFEETCCQAVFNATDPREPFDPGSAFFVVPQAFGLARAVAVPVADVVSALTPD